MYLICENCFQVIGQFDPATIRLPLTADQFISHLPAKRNVPGPFTPGSDWQHFKCPYCPRRPIFEHDRLYASQHRNGKDPRYIQLPIESEPQVEPLVGQGAEDAPLPDDKYACPDCGQVYQNEKRYKMYHKCKVRASS